MKFTRPEIVRFERRDALLVAGLLLFMVGLLPFMAPVYAVIIVILMYLGIKVYVGRRRRAIERDVGRGLCMECGSRIVDHRCPRCDAGE